MVDNLTEAQRSYTMTKVKSKNTAPEKKVRTLLHRLGYRFRLHRKNLPGKPDIVFPKHKLIIFVHGCFWHQHKNCKKAKRPKSRTDYWDNKLQKNITRDKSNQKKLQKLGWRCEIIWECETKHHDTLVKKIIDIFSKNSF